MSRFNQFLHQTDERLTLPRTTRSQILVEIAADLEDLFNHYLSEGLSEKEAAARAEEKVAMSDEALAELVRIHSSTRGWADRLVRRAQSLGERLAMGIIVLFFVAGLSFGSDPNPLAHLNGFALPIFAVLGLVIITFVLHSVHLTTDPPNPRKMRERLATPLFLGAAAVVLGFGGAGVTLNRALRAMVAEPERAPPLFAQGLLESTSTLSVALLVALCAGLAWFILAGRIARVEDDLSRDLTEVP